MESTQTKQLLDVRAIVTSVQEEKRKKERERERQRCCRVLHGNIESVTCNARQVPRIPCLASFLLYHSNGH